MHSILEMFEILIVIDSCLDNRADVLLTIYLKLWSLKNVLKKSLLYNRFQICYNNFFVKNSLRIVDDWRPSAFFAYLANLKKKMIHD